MTRKIGIFVISAGTEPWNSIEDLGQRETFAKMLPPNQSIYWYQGSARKNTWIELFCSKYFEKSYELFWTAPRIFNELHVRRLNRQSRPGFVVRLFNRIMDPRFDAFVQMTPKQILRMPESGRFGTCGLRVGLAIKFFLDQTNADYMLLTNSTSFFIPEVLQKYVEKLPTTRVYAGASNALGPVTFKSGAATIISRDVAHELYMNRRDWNHEYPQDVAMGQIIQKYDLAEPFEFGVSIIEDPREVESKFKRTPRQVFHFRCKTGESIKSIQIMKTLHHLVQPGVDYRFKAQ